MSATFSIPLARDIGFGWRTRSGGALLGDVPRVTVVAAALTLFALAGVWAALLLPRSAPAPRTTSLSPTSTTVAPHVSARH